MLRELSIYGTSRGCVRAHEDAAFGVALHDAVPEDGFDDQPLIKRGRYLLAADIRIDNRNSLLRRLNIRGADELPDSELFIQAWDRWGAQALDHITGDYAFALYDTRTRRLTLARDPTGQRPLYFTLSGDIFVFASMVSGILACPLVNARFDYPALASMLAGTGPTGASTYFAGVERVCPGQILEWSPSGLTRTWHWHPPQEFLDLPSEDYVAAYRELLGESVSAAMRRKTGLLGVHLSAGWDSGAVAATAAMLVASGSMPIAYTAAPRRGFDGPVPRGRVADESGMAELVAKMHNLEHHVVRPDRGVLDHLRSFARFYQEPNCNVVNMEWLSQIYELANARGVTTLLTGELGNLTLNAGGLPVLAEWVRQGRWRSWWTEAKAARRHSEARWRGVLVNSFERQIPPALMRLVDRKFRDVPTLSEQNFARPEWADARHADQHLPIEDDTANYRSRLALIRSNDLGNFRKGALAQFNIDERDPTANRKLLDFSFSLPPEQFLHNGEWRPLARKALADRLPQPVLSCELRGYQGADWFERIGPNKAREVLEEISSSSTVQQLFDLEKIGRALDSWPGSDWADQRQIQIYRTRIPIALATGVFIQEFESATARPNPI